MNIIKPYAKILPLTGSHREFLLCDGIQLLKRIEWCARISHRSEESVTEDSYDRFIRSVVLQHGDWSVVEHATVSCDFYVDRGITHELVRHRLFSFTQESTRFVNYKKKMEPSFVMPPLMPEQQRAWVCAIEAAEKQYQEIIESGVAPQIARSVFPNALASRIIITGNLRNWRWFLIARTTKQVHPQMLEVTLPLLEEFKEKIPILYEDIIPNRSQSEAFQLLR